MRRKILLALAVVVAVLGAAAGGVRGYLVWRNSQDELPALVDVPAGIRAPTREFLGLAIGRSTLAEAELAYRSAGVTCGNSSFRAIMAANREQTKKKMAEAEARGDDPDGVTGASLANYRSKKERNPQIRLACEGVPVSTFSDRERAAGEPLYWLIIFDNERHALRHTSITRRIADPAIAAEEWRSAIDNLTRRFGAPSRLKAPEGSDVPKGAYYEAKWQFADLEAQVTAFRIGDSVRFTEKVEVPWPVRVDDAPE